LFCPLLANLELWPGLLSFQISKFNTPEIHPTRNDFYTHIPPVWSLDSLPYNHGFDSAPRGQIREPQTLLQFEFPRAYE